MRHRILVRSSASGVSAGRWSKGRTKAVTEPALHHRILAQPPLESPIAAIRLIISEKNSMLLKRGVLLHGPCVACFLTSYAFAALL